ncbi:MAG: beta-lactamase family protein [Candidatus Krumholzibacteriota bacterium]|nr:beta-lactamase family protein [Candidatus Krumholzibacteriota bacterium]
MKIIIRTFLLFGMAFFISCSKGGERECERTFATVEAEAGIDTLLAGVLARDSTIPGISIYIDQPGLCLSYGSAAGFEGMTGGAPLTVDHAFRIASNTKTFIAVSILRLFEEGKIRLDDPISHYLPPLYVDMLVADGYRPDMMRIRHLLTHTSGMYEHAGEEYTEMILDDPGRKWSRLDQLKLAIELGAPYGGPGERWHYSDTGYILLGKILEEVTGKTMAGAMRDLVGFDRLGLDHTWTESVEAVPAAVGAIAHQYFGDADSYDVDPSIDLYGGGGLISTARDLALFEKALFSGQVYKQKSTLDTMLSMVIAPDQGTYRAGIWSIEVDGITGWGHTGFWNTFTFYFPEIDLAVAGAVTRRNAVKGRVLTDEAVRIIRGILEKKGAEESGRPL